MEQTQHLMRTAAAAYRRFAESAEQADPELPTRLADWRVRDLVDHVTWGAAMEAAAVRTARGLAADPVGPGLAGAVTAFERAARLEVEPELPVTVPAGTVPAGFAAALFTLEAAIHDADLTHALTGHQPKLGAEELAACEVVIGPMLDLVGGDVPDDGVVIDLIGLGDGIRLSAVRGSWHRGVPDERPATTTLVGDAQGIVLFACGRLDARELLVQGREEHVRRFKEYFPGP